MKKFENGKKVYFDWALGRLMGTYIGLTADKTRHVIEYDEQLLTFSDDKIHKIEQKIIVNGIEVNAPMRELPEFGTDCFCLHNGEVGRFTWSCTTTSENKFKLGIFDNEEDAQAYYDALYKPVMDYLAG